MENNKRILLKFGLWLLTGIIVCLIGTFNVKALDYTENINIGGKRINDVFSISPKSSLVGVFSYHGVVADTNDYLMIGYCATGYVTTWTNGIAIPVDGYHIETGQWCSTGNYSGTIQYYYYPVSQWYYKENNLEKYVEVTSNNPFTWHNNEDYNVYVKLLSVTTSSTFDVSTAILAYLRSQNSSQDYTSILNDIKNNQNNYTNELNQVENAINSSNGKLDTVNDNLSNLNDNLTSNDTSNASSEAGNFFSGFETDTFGLTSIITAPLNLIGSITSSTCSPLPLKIPFLSENNTLNLPCFKSIYEQYFGSFLTIYQTITFGIVAYWVCVKIFNLVKDFKNPDHDEIEVLDL